MTMESNLFRRATRADTGQTSAETEDCQRRPPWQNEQGPADRQGPLIKTLREGAPRPAGMRSRKSVDLYCRGRHFLSPKTGVLGRFSKDMVAHRRHNLSLAVGSVHLARGRIHP